MQRDPEADLAEPLTVLELDDAELGIRSEDRYAAIPPGPTLIRRRVHDESTRAPLLLLAALVLFFLLGAWLDRGGSERDAAGPTFEPAPALDRPTRTRLLLLAEGRATVLDVDRRATTTLRNELPGRVRDAAASGGWVVVLADSTLVLPAERGEGSAPRELPPADDVFTAAEPGRVWLVTAAERGTSNAREIDIAAETETATVTVEGSVVGAVANGLVVERPSGAIDVVARDGSAMRAFDERTIFVAAGGETLASRAPACTAGDCDIVLDDVTTGRRSVVRAPLAVGAEVASVSPDGRRLAILRSDGVITRGVLVDVDLGSATLFRARPTRRNSSAPLLAWSSDGNWLFVATNRAGMDAVDRSGHTFRVDVTLPEFDALVTRG